jgi:hypothetical protein
MKTLKSWNCRASIAGAILLGALATLPARAQTYDSILQGESPSDWWKFDETTPSPAINEVANSGTDGAPGTGYVVGGVTLGEPGVVGTSAFFSNAGQGTGNCSARIDIPNSPAFNPAPPFTIEFWAKANAPYAPSDSTGLAPVSSLTVSGAASFEGARSGYIFYVTPTTWTMRLGGVQSYTAICTAVAPASTNSFTHVVGEFDGSTASVYINGVLAATAGASDNPFQPNNFAATRIGGSSLPGSEYEDGNGGVVVGSGNRGWDGWVDEFAVYNTLLSSNTIMAHYTAGTTSPSTYDALVIASSPTGYWHLDEPAYTTPSPSNTVAADSGSLADAGTNTLGALADQPGVAGASDLSVYYNGATGSLVLDPSVTNIIDVAGQTITLAAWINPTSFGYVSDIIAQGYDETTYSENFLRVGNAFDWAYFQDNSSGGNYNSAVVPDVDFYEVGAFTGNNPGYVSAVFPAPPGDIGHWVYLVGTFDGANWNLYRNGALAASFTDPLETPGPAPVSIPWAVGSRSNPNPYFGMFFAGGIAEPSILTTALDAVTISNLYNSVALPPVVTEAPSAPSVVYEGSAADFSVWADGPGGLAYQWYSNNVLIAGQTGTNLLLTGLTASFSADYSVVISSAYGSVTSSVELVVAPTLPPVTLTPATEVRWLGFPLSFAPVSLPNQQLSFQWDLNGNPINGATQSSYTAPAVSGTAGSYTLVISNSFGVSTSSVSTLSLKTPPNDYVSTILGDGPLSYFRLDESAGPTAYDDAGGNNGTYFGNVTLGVPGYSLVDTDTAASFPGTALSYVGDIGPTAINFNGPEAEFSIEAWANGPAIQVGSAAVIAKGHSNNGTTANEQFALIVSSGDYSFFVRDSKGNAATATAPTGPDGNWHYIAGVCDYQGLGGSGPGLFLYIDGIQVAVAALPGSLVSSGIINQEDPVSIGSESSGPGPTYEFTYTGTIDEVAIYPTNLTSVQVSNHYAAAYGPDLAPFITSQPVSVTNYVSFPVSVTVAAAGTQPLSYQWNQNGVPVSGATSPTYTIANAALSDAGTYTVGITNTLTGGVVTGIVSAPCTITILPAPTNPPAISGLVMHLTFNGTLADATGRGNDATNEASGGAPLLTNDYESTSGQTPWPLAFTYQTTIDPTTNANYASIGVRPDLQFGTSSFSVSMWVQFYPFSAGGDLPFFCDVIGSTFSFPGFCFEPSFDDGGWGFSVFGATDAGMGVYGSPNDSINDGNFHSLIYILDRVAGPTIYVDGSPAAYTLEGGTSLAAAGNINTPQPAIIGQDPTGLYPQAGSYGISDLGVWTRALTKLEAESIYLGAISNQVSFTGAASFNLNVLPGNQLQLTWSAGSLQSATNLNGPWTTLTNTSPYVASPTNKLEFFRAQF